MPLPVPALLLSGFALAHAAWSVSDLPKGDLLCPLAMVEMNGERLLTRFEAATQAEAIARGKESMAKMTETADAWAFARDGLIRAKDGSKIDVITIDFWSKGMAHPASLIQRYEPFAEHGKFRLIGDPELVIDGVVQTQDQTKEAIQTINQGIANHSKVAAMWEGWHSK